MICPKCNTKTKVVDSRRKDSYTVRRRHACGKCQYRFSTYERMTDISIYISDLPKNVYGILVKQGYTNIEISELSSEDIMKIYLMKKYLINLKTINENLEIYEQIKIWEERMKAIKNATR